MSDEVLSRHEGETDADFIARLERHAQRSFAAAASGKQWPHHSEQERRTGYELLAQARAVRDGAKP
jgi:hypothetical protein